MKRQYIIGFSILLLITHAGCSSILPQKEGNPAVNSTTEEIKTPTIGNNFNRTRSSGKDGDDPKEDGFVDNLQHELQNKSIDLLNVEKNRSTIHVRYRGGFHNYNETRDTISVIIVSFSNILNNRTGKGDWNTTELIIHGHLSPSVKTWEFKTEGWWGLKYRRTNWSKNDYVDATLATGEDWNLTTQSKPRYGDAYLSTLREKIKSQTDIQIKELENHGAEAFLTIKTGHVQNSNSYYSQIVNITDAYKELTLPRRLNETGGWYAGVLNIEAHDDEGNVEWFRYRIWWAEKLSKDQITPQEELRALLRYSRFPKSKDAIKTD